MKQIGGFFTYNSLPQEENHFFESCCGREGQIEFFMSGRCANYYVLENIRLTDRKKVAYVPIYTCETVLAPFLKAGYQLLYYGITKDMVPVFDDSVLDDISVINLCGYYGFCNYDRSFIKKCSEKGIVIVEDTTHSIFSADGIDPYSDYVVGSMRKWIGIASGGFAIKRKGKFGLPIKPPHPLHLHLRRQTIAMEETLTDGQINFWSAEMMLREIFDSYGSDSDSIEIMTHYDFHTMSLRRRENYKYLLDHLPPHPQLQVVFPVLRDGTVPSHFTIYANQRSQVQTYMADKGIKTTTYWPLGPMVDISTCDDARYIYDHVLSIPCDQRYDTEDMDYICRQIYLMP